MALHERHTASRPTSLRQGAVAAGMAHRLLTVPCMRASSRAIWGFTSLREGRGGPTIMGRGVPTKRRRARQPCKSVHRCNSCVYVYNPCISVCNSDCNSDLLPNVLNYDRFLLKLSHFLPLHDRIRSDQIRSNKIRYDRFGSGRRRRRRGGGGTRTLPHKWYGRVG